VFSYYGIEHSASCEQSKAPQQGSDGSAAGGG